MALSRYLLLLALCPAVARGGEVDVSASTWLGLLPPPDAPVPPPGPTVASRDVTLRVVEGGTELTARFVVTASEPGWLDTVLVGAPGMHVASVRRDGAPAATRSDRDGLVLTDRFTGRSTVEVRAFLPGDPVRTPLRLTLAEAISGRLAVDAPGLEAEVEAADRPAVRDGAAFWTGARAVTVSLVPPAGATPDAPLVVAHAGLGVTIGDAELQGRGRIEWLARRGSVERVSFTARGTGGDLAVTGANVREVRRTGEVVVVDLQTPTDRVSLDVRFSERVPTGVEGRLSLPVLEPTDVFRAETSLQVARDGEIEVVPTLRRGTPVPASSLPEWGQGLIEGTPTAAWTGAEGGTLEIFRFEAVPGPAAVVDVAAYDVAASEEGRVLMRVRYEVRNERASHLALAPPEGMRVLGVRVAGETAMPFRDRAGAWRIPLVRSVETVEGLLTFSVEVTLLGEDAAWARAETRRLPLPVVDAPVAVSRVTLYLPPGYTSKLDDGDGYVVDAFTEGEGITYGFGLAEADTAKADALYRDAVSAWMTNDFETAQVYLDELEEIGASNFNTRGLQSNLDVIDGKDTGGEEEAVTRRVKEQARARSLEEERQAEEYWRQGQEAELAGNLAGAASAYGSSLSLREKVGKLEQTESVEQKARAEVTAQAIEIVAEKRKSVGGFKKAAEPAAIDANAAPEPPEEPMSPPAFARPSPAPPTTPSQDGSYAQQALPAPPPEDPERAKYLGDDDVGRPAVGYLDDTLLSIESEPATAPDVDVTVRTFQMAGVTRGGRGGGGPAARASASSAESVSRDARRATRGDDEDRRGAEVDEAANVDIPAVHASALSVTVPAAGQAVRFQQLLVPASAAPEVVVVARDSRRRR